MKRKHKVLICTGILVGVIVWISDTINASQEISLIFVLLTAFVGSTMINKYIK